MTAILLTNSKRSFAILLATFLCLHTSPCCAQLLWKIDGGGLKQTSYLFGTHHLIPVTFLDSVPGLFRAFNKCHTVVGEITMNHVDADDKIMKASMLPKGITIDSLLSEDNYALVDAEIKSVLKIGLKELSLMKPSVIHIMYEMEIYRQHTGHDSDVSSDTFFQQVAMQKNKKVVGLESIDMQINLLFGSTNLKEEALLLVEAVQHKEEILREIESVNALYLKGEIEKLAELGRGQGKLSSMDDEEYARLVKERNFDWIEQLPDLMLESPCFVAVGAMHLGGEQGLISLLRKKGYKVKPVK